MKKKILSIMVLSSMTLSGFIYASLSKETSSEPSQVSLNSIEVLSNCEVSSNASNNKGYCSRNYNSSGDSCTETGDPASVRCSGNF